jgi:hypothetical protein
MRKPQGNSKLKTLPPEVQARIADWCAQDTLESAVSRCASELSPPVQTNRDSMGKFYRWWRDTQETAVRKETLEHLFRRADVNAKAVAGMLKESGATEDQIARADQLVFTLQASSVEDKELFIELEKLRIARESAEHKARMDVAKLQQKQEELKLAERRVKLLEDREKKAREVMVDAALSAEEKEKRIKAVFGIAA